MAPVPGLVVFETAQFLVQHIEVVGNSRLYFLETPIFIHYFSLSVYATYPH